MTTITCDICAKKLSGCVSTVPILSAQVQSLDIVLRVKDELAPALNPTRITLHHFRAPLRFEPVAAHTQNCHFCAECFEKAILEAFKALGR